MTASPARSARRDELLAATRRVAGRVGFAATTVGEITKEAGASLGLLHHYFDSKAEVVAETFALVAREDLGELQAAARGPAPAAERLAAVLDLSEWEDRESWGLWIDAWGEAMHSEPMRDTLAGFQQGWRTLLAAVLADGVEEGAWACPDPSDAAARLVAVIDGIGLHATLHGELVPAAQATAWVRRVAALELGVSLPEAPAARGEPPAALELRLPLRQDDVDAAGRVTPAACAALLGEARAAWLAERLPGAEARLARLEVEHEAVAAGDLVIASCAVARLGRAGVRTHETLLRGGDGAVVAAAQATLDIGRPLSDDERTAVAR